MVQRSGGTRGAAPLAPPAVHQALRSPGQPLDAGVRSFLEPRLGHDFSQVRVHTGARAADSARAVGARAYTVGRDVVFGAGEYRPASADGRRLLAHELAHVVQQGSQVRRAAPTTVGEPGDASEHEADAVASAVMAGGQAAVGHTDRTPTVRRQGLGTLGCGLVTDPVTHTPSCVNHGGCAGTCVLHNPFPLPPFCACEPGGALPAPPSPGLPTPPLPLPPPPGLPGPAPPAPPAPPPAPPVVVRDVEVDNSRTAITYPVPSNLGAAGREHHVTIAGTRPDVVFRAVTDPVVPAGDPRLAGLRWESDPAGRLGAGADALHATASVPTARKVVARAVLGASAAELTLWAVFVDVQSGGTTLRTRRDADGLAVGADAAFTGRVHPAAITTDADRPALHGARTVPPPPPGGTNICGLPLDGGADRRWDMSRQIQQQSVDPDGVLPAILATKTPDIACLYHDTAYPAAPEVGNDDAGTAVDENNNPYGTGVITSEDSPTSFFPDSAGTDGDTFEQQTEFREFARLDFHRTWWKISHFTPWRLHARIVKVAGRWQDNGSDAADDNTF